MVTFFEKLSLNYKKARFSDRVAKKGIISTGVYKHAYSEVIPKGRGLLAFTIKELKENIK